MSTDNTLYLEIERLKGEVREAKADASILLGQLRSLHEVKMQRDAAREDARRAREALAKIVARQEKWNHQDDVGGVECVVDMGEIAEDALSPTPTPAARTCGEGHDWRLVGTTDELPQGALYYCHCCHARAEVPSNVTGSMFVIATWLDEHAILCKVKP